MQWSEGSPSFRPAQRQMAVLFVALLAALTLAACGGKKDKISTQAAARVNKDEITVHQVNFVLQQQRGIQAGQAQAAGKQVLERLIDQQLAVQRAEELKLDRDPRVVQSIEAARREILARSYAEKVGETAAKPTAEEVKAYYDANPALFSERRVYSLQELQIEAKPEQVALLHEKLQGAKNVGEFADYLRANDFKFNGTQAVRAAEQLPLASLGALSQLKDGQALINTTPTGATVVVLAGSRPQPVDEARARPAIEQFLLNDRKRDLVSKDMKALRGAATIQYLGKFAEAAASAPAAEAPAPESAASAASAPFDMTEGLKGLKKTK
jgi:EpsD family peptidyl-prolyl cis-trans isomerase